jgi:hypothetical protein
MTLFTHFYLEISPSHQIGRKQSGRKNLTGPRRVPQIRQPAPACRGSVPGTKKKGEAHDCSPSIAQQNPTRK